MTGDSEPISDERFGPRESGDECATCYGSGVYPADTDDCPDCGGSGVTP